MKVSVLIVTKNRAADLAETLRAMRSVRIPEGLDGELVVVDNGSTDETREVVKSLYVGAMSLRYILEPHGGQSAGRNRGIAESDGEVILFTDDDVRPPADWVSRMCDPVFGAKADAVSGGVVLAPHLLRSWMTETHQSWLAATNWIAGEVPRSMVGANMAFSRAVLEKVGGFDPELGPGALGFGDDSLFASQILKAGFRVHNGTDVVLEHHFEESRLMREAWLDAAERRGRSHAYRGHHWEHWNCRFSLLKEMLATRRLDRWRSENAEKIRPEGCEGEELDLVFNLALVRAHVRESQRSRNYDKHGLTKKVG